MLHSKHLECVSLLWSFWWNLLLHITNLHNVLKVVGGPLSRRCSWQRKKNKKHVNLRKWGGAWHIRQINCVWEVLLNDAMQYSTLNSPNSWHIVWRNCIVYGYIVETSSIKTRNTEMPFGGKTSLICLRPNWFMKYNFKWGFGSLLQQLQLLLC